MLTVAATVAVVVVAAVAMALVVAMAMATAMAMAMAMGELLCRAGKEVSPLAACSNWDTPTQSLALPWLLPHLDSYGEREEEEEEEQALAIGGL
jgi:hypothetical protein